MAQPLNDPDMEVKNDDNNDHIWPMSLILNPAYAAAFLCVKCQQIPKACWNNEEADILCSKCAQNFDNVTETKVVQKLVNKLKTKCLSISQSKIAKANINPTDETEGSNVLDTKVYETLCDWIGQIEEYKQHALKCPFVIIICNKCNSSKSQRQLMPKHLKECPQVYIDCPLLCGVKILRKNTENHLENICIKQLLLCTNDDCKMEIEREYFQQHIEQKCDFRIIKCKFEQYGCNIKNIHANNLQKHMNEYKFKHLSKQFDFVTQKLNNTIIKQKDKITSLEHQIQLLNDESKQNTKIHQELTKNLKNLSNEVQLLKDESKQNTNIHKELTNHSKRYQFNQTYSGAFNYVEKTAIRTSNGHYVLPLVQPITKYNNSVKFKMNGDMYYGIGYGEDKLKSKGFPGTTKNAWMIYNANGETYSDGKSIGSKHWKPQPGNHVNKEVEIMFDLETHKFTIKTNGKICVNKGNEFNVDTNNKLYFIWAIKRKGYSVTLID